MFNVIGFVAAAYDANGNRLELAYSDTDLNFAVNYKNGQGTTKVLLTAQAYQNCATDLDIDVAAQPLMAQVNPAIAVALNNKIAAAQAAQAALG